MEVKPQIRYLEELEKVVYDKEWFKKAKNFPLYYIFRGVKEKNEIRYDITVIPPNLLGKEFVKTKGHYHIGNFGELYKVLAGEGIFLMQKKDLSDVYFVRAKRGDFVKIPPNYGHTIINPSGKTLKIANWVSKYCQSITKVLKKWEDFAIIIQLMVGLKIKIIKKFLN
jgi:glucose-6-phosphate isomerase